MKIKSSDENIRIDKYLSTVTDYSREYISKMIKDGFVLVNNNKIKPSYIVSIGDEVDIDESFKIENNIVGEDINVDIIYEDDDLMVINKPSGMVVHPGSGNYNHTLVNALV